MEKAKIKKQIIDVLTAENMTYTSKDGTIIAECPADEPLKSLTYRFCFQKDGYTVSAEYSLNLRVFIDRTRLSALDDFIGRANLNNVAGCFVLDNERKTLIYRIFIDKDKAESVRVHSLILLAGKMFEVFAKGIDYIQKTHRANADAAYDMADSDLIEEAKYLSEWCGAVKEQEATLIGKDYYALIQKRFDEMFESLSSCDTADYESSRVREHEYVDKVAQQMLKRFRERIKGG